jgi:protease-4
MSLDPDQIIDRRRLKRRLTRWRVVAVLAVVVALVVGVSKIDAFDDQAHIALVQIDNVIFEDRRRTKIIRELATDPDVEAVVVRINSPGGTVVGGESLYSALREIAENKPVVAVIDELAASAGYMVAIGADYIIARQGSITGSIGVIMQTTDITGLLGKLGIAAEAIKSSPLKAQPNPLEPFSPEARAATQAVVSDIYDMFVDLVAQRRSLPIEAAQRLSDGRVYTGRQALKNGLIDKLGGEKDALAWLVEAKGIVDGLAIKPIRVRRKKGLLRDLLDDTVGKSILSERLRLDGLISLWHPEVN